MPGAPQAIEAKLCNEDPRCPFAWALPWFCFSFGFCFRSLGFRAQGLAFTVLTALVVGFRGFRACMPAR